MGLRKLIKDDTKTLTEKVNADNYIYTENLSYRKGLVVIADKMESLIMELKPYVSNEQFIELMREANEPTSLSPIIKKIVPQLYRKNPTAGRIALELQIFLDGIVIECFCGAYELEDFTYSLHSVKNIVLKEAIEKAETKVMSKTYLKTDNKEKAVEKKIEELQVALKPYLSDDKFDGLDDMEKLGCLITELYAEGNTTAFNTAVELRAVIDCLQQEFICAKRKQNEIERVNKAKEETAYYDSFLKNFKSAQDRDEDFYTFSFYDNDQSKRFKKYENDVCSRDYFQGCEIFKGYDTVLSEKLNELKEGLKPYLSELGYKELSSANPDKTYSLLSHLLDRFEECNKVASNKVLEMQAFIKIWFKGYGKKALKYEDKKIRKKVLADDYLERHLDDEAKDEYHWAERTALLRKLNQLKGLLKPYLPQDVYESLVKADLINTLGIIEDYMFKSFITNNKRMLSLLKELECFIVERIFRWEDYVDESNNDLSGEEVEQDAEFKEEVEKDPEQQKKKTLYDSCVKDYHNDIDELLEKDDYNGYFAFDKVEEKYYLKFKKQFSAKNYISNQNLEQCRQIIIDKLNELKAALKPYLTEVGYNKLLTTNPSKLGMLVREQFGTRFYQNGNVGGINAVAQLRAFIDTVVCDFARKDMKVANYRQKVMDANYLGNYQNYSAAIYQKLHELKTALKPYLAKKEYLSLLVKSPLGTQMVICDLISRFYYDEHNTTATAIAVELRELIQCRVAKSYSYNF